MSAILLLKPPEIVMYGVRRRLTERGLSRFDNDVVTVTGNTGSVGRALALCGFGTQFSPELDEVSGGRFADSPQPMGGGGGATAAMRPMAAMGAEAAETMAAGAVATAARPPGNGDGARFTPPREVSAPRRRSEARAAREPARRGLRPPRPARPTPEMTAKMTLRPCRRRWPAGCDRGRSVR